jgi:bacterioferritin (cytochrome b1)
MEEIVKALNECYRHELSTVLRYHHASVRTSGLDRLHLAEMFRASAADALGHATKIGEKIVALGGTPQGKISEDLAALPSTNEKMLEHALKDEEVAVRNYAAAIPLARNDLALRELLVHILKDEQSHVDQLRLLLKK